VTIDAKDSNKAPKPQHIKRTICHNQIVFTQGLQGWSNQWKSITVIDIYRMKEKYSTIISSDSEKAFDKI
jgi:hypothetical protein